MSTTVSPKPLRIMVVDDRPEIASALERSLKVDLGRIFIVDIVTASDGQDALRKWADFDILVTDITMPVMDGFELTKELRAQGSNVTIFLMTGYTEHDLSALSEFTDRPLINKPFEREVLTSLLLDAATDRMINMGVQYQQPTTQS